MMKGFLVICLCALACCPGCDSTEKKSLKNEFPRIEIPAMLTSGDALKYTVKHYWDKFTDSSRVAAVREAGQTGKNTGWVLGIDSVKFEEAFGEYAAAVNYLQSGDNATVGSSVRNLIRKADRMAVAGDSSLLFRLMSYFEKYFYNPNSPYLNEEVYIPAVQGILEAKALGELDKMQYEYQLKISELNRVGTPAADFAYATTNGKGSLYDLKADYTLVFFNNPDCPACSEIREILQADPGVSGLVENGRLKILTMYIDEELELWRKNREKYPREWIYAYDNRQILRDNNIYGLRAIPSLYLLDKTKKVLLKDANVNQVIAALNNLA